MEIPDGENGIKQDPEDFIDVESNEISESNSLSLNEPSTSNSVSNDESTLPYDHTEEKEIKEEILDTPPEPNYDEIGEFCFESDHLALKSNCDYKNLLEAIVVLEAQRAQAITDLDRLLECQDEALADPIKFVERLQKKENLQIPALQKIHHLPAIDWGKYALSGNPSVFGRRQLTRLSTKVAQDFGKIGRKGKQGFNSDTKPKLSQYWTAEEQKKLEELLVQFPPEEVETRRWEKIASCLENRTPIQVASRVQKYFIKLLKAGIPVPGRMPSTYKYLKKPRRNVIRQQPSTFLVSQQLPVYMPDVEEEIGYGYSQTQCTDENSLESKMDISEDDDEDIIPELRNTPEFHELMMLRKVQKEKLKSSSLAHVGYKCCHCKVEPIIGIRWHCTVCKTQSIDFCADCVECDFETGAHTSDHRLESIQHANTTFLDRDYMHFLGSDYNYLDPNYMPAT